jgi:mono/diheme cytochrome c family protein
LVRVVRRVAQDRLRLAPRTGLRHVRDVRGTIVVGGIALCGLARAEYSLPPPQPPVSQAGWALYDRYCLACHGALGDGAGPAAPWLAPRPRNFQHGAFAWRTTASGSPPTREDVVITILYGAPGAMPAFGDVLSPGELDQLVDVVQAYTPGTPFARTRTRHAALAKAGDAGRGAQLWTARGCARCHGDGGQGDGPAAATLTDAAGEKAPPYDLTRVLLRRPRAPDGDREAIADSIAYGLDGTAMPGNPSLGPEALADLVAYVDSIRAHGAAPENAWPIPARAIEADRAAFPRFDGGTWPGRGDSDDAVLFGGPIEPQGPPSATLAPAEASLSEQQCARCHAKQAREWTDTIHAQATAPGVVAQLPSMAGAQVAACQRCHAPLAEQRTDLPLRAQGVTCSACHVRWWTRFGPPRVASSLIPIGGYPLREQAIYERGDFCLPCHQLPARDAVDGRPLLDTYREWLLGPYMRRGVQCQHCHMPNREHTWKGVHDPDTFRQGIRVEAIAARTRDGVVSVRARVWNQGAGHFLPTTPTPAAWLRVELIDAHGAPIAGARADKRIGRAIAFVDGAWQVREDTRIPPGESLELAGAWTDGRVAEAASARVTVEVHPDDYYEGFYRTKLAGTLSADERAPYEAALARATGSHYVAYTRDVRVTIAP